MANRDTHTRLHQLQTRVQHWRNTRQKHAAMPAELWTEATALAHQLGVNAVRLAARIDYGALKRRVEAPRTEADAPAVGHGHTNPNAATRFLDLGAVGAASATDVTVEVVDTSGARLTIWVPGGRALDVAGVVSAFRSVR
jgi:hypothetical protein